MNSLLKTLKVAIVIGLIIFIPSLVYYYTTDLRYPIPEDSQIVIRLTRGSAYEITIYENGTVVYDGKRFVGVAGIRKENIGSDKVRELVRIIEQKGYFELDERYSLEGVYDAGAVITYVKMGPKEKEIFRQDVVLDVPELIHIENLIDRTTDSQKWVECRQPLWLLCEFNPYVLASNLMFFIIAEWTTWSFIQRRKTILGISLGYAIIVLYGFIIWFGKWSISTQTQGLKSATFELIALLPVGLFFVWWHNRRIKIDVTTRGTEQFGRFIQ